MKKKYKKLSAALAALITAVSLSSCVEVDNEPASNVVKKNKWSSSEEVKPTETEAVTTTAPEPTTEETTTTTTEITTTTVTTTVETTTTTTTTAAPVKGNLYDAKGKLLMKSTFDEDGAEQRTLSKDYKICFGNILHSVSGGLDHVFDDTLRTAIPSENEEEQPIGQSVRLTFDAEVQKKIYQYMEKNNIIGSVVVMRNDGSLMSEVSYPSYDPELFLADDNYASSLTNGACLNKAFQNASPGSCFKIMSEIICDKHDITCLYDEGTWVDNGSTIVNWDHDKGNYPIKERTLNSAFINSSNIFFAKAFQQIGAEAVFEDLGTLFNFGWGYEIYCDFGPIENNIEVYCDDDLRRSAFGQAYVRTCPIYLAALGREAVFGDMVKPFTMKSIVDTGNIKNVLSKGSPSYEVIATIPEEYRRGILDGMAGVASNLGIGIPDGYKLYAKTGTAETGEGDFLYITGCVKNNNDDGSKCSKKADYSDYKASGGSYTIVMQLRNAKEHKFDFASQSAQLYKGIIDIVLA